MPFGTPNFIGVHTTAELAALPIEKVRRGMWCWNSTNTRPEIYNGTAWVPFCGGFGSDEIPTTYHDLYGLPEIVASGQPSQRTICRDSDGRNFYLYQDAVTGTLYLVTEMNPDVTDPKQRSVNVFQLTMQTYGKAPLTPETDSFCMTIQQDDTIHILFEAVTGGVVTDVYDAYFLASAVPSDPPTPPAPVALLLDAERINQISDADRACVWPSAAASGKLVGGQSTVVVAFVQYSGAAPAGVGQIVIANYAPAAPAGGRYNVVPEVIISHATQMALMPTVECSPLRNHVVFMEELEAPGEGYHPYYATEVGAGWTTMVLGTPIDSLGAINVDGEATEGDISAPSMVVTRNSDGDVLVSVVVQAMGTTDDTYLVAFHFTPDIVAGVPTVFSEEYTDVFDDVRVENGYALLDMQIRSYQLGASNQDTDTPVLYLYKHMSEGERSGDVIDHMLSYRFAPIEDGVAVEPWASVPLMVGCGRSLLRCKTHYAWFAYNRDWRDPAENPYYPVNTSLKTILKFHKDQEEQVLAAALILIAKDIPEYPLAP